MTVWPFPDAVRLSVVTTLYRSEPFVRDFCRAAVAAAESLGGTFEIILVNDGSPDGALDIAIELSDHDPRIRVIDLSRNFGHHKALMTGLIYSRGELVFLLDSDLEEDPMWLLQFHERLVAERADVVYGVQEHRKGSPFERAAGAVYYRVFNAMIDHPLPRNVVTARLMTRRYVDQLVRHEDREVCIAALWVMTGFHQVPIVISKGRRATASAYGVTERIGVFVNLITSFSTRPLIYIFYLGCAIMASAIVAGLYLVWRVVARGSGVAGWPSLIVSVWFLGGVTIFCLGVIGMYVAKVFTETKRRPYTVVRAEYPARAVSRQDRHDVAR
jgi:putative glycosyltransferase